MTSSQVPPTCSEPPMVSVVIPTYNRANVVIAAVESVLSQTWKGYELIVIDDGSTDDTRAMLDRYMRAIRYVYQPNEGVSAAQNKGIAMARGAWVSILASDDVWLPTKLETQLRTIALLGEEFGACFTDCIYVGDPRLTQSMFERAGFHPARASGECCDAMRLALQTFPAACVQSLLIRRSLLSEIGGFDENLAVAEDADLIFRLCLKTRFCFVSERLVSIDATPSVPRLTDLIAHKNDQVFASYEYRYRKWLAMTGYGREIREEILAQLAQLYYDWMISGLARLSAGTLLAKWRALRRLEISGRAISAALCGRAAAKAARSLRGLQRRAINASREYLLSGA